MIWTPEDSTTADAGAEIVFTGTALDSEDGPLTGESLIWTSSLDGVLGNGTSLARSDLSLGEHVVTLDATDSEGAPASSQVVLTVVDGPPTVEILQPSDGTVVKVGDEVVFEGAASDHVDGALSGASLVYRT